MCDIPASGMLAAKRRLQTLAEQMFAICWEAEKLISIQIVIQITGRTYSANLSNWSAADC